MSTSSQNPPAPGGERLSISPVRCPDTGCHWGVHGIPDQYTQHRAWHLAEHRAKEHGEPLTAEQIAFAQERGLPLPASPQADEPNPAPLSPQREAGIRAAVAARPEVLADDYSALLAELARLRAEREQSRIVIADLRDRLGDQAREWIKTQEEVEALEAERDELKQRLHDAAMVRTWKLENGKKFVYVEDLAPALLGTDAQPTECVTEYGIRIPDGRVLEARSGRGDDYLDQAARDEIAGRLPRYREMWPGAVMVQRTVNCGTWNQVADGGEPR